MAVPKNKRPRSRTHSRRSQWKTTAPELVICPDCNTPKKSHIACPTCGKYKDRTYKKAIRSEFVAS